MSARSGRHHRVAESAASSADSSVPFPRAEEAGRGRGAGPPALSCYGRGLTTSSEEDGDGRQRVPSRESRRGRVRTMHSLGMGKTLLKHITTPNDAKQQKPGGDDSAEDSVGREPAGEKEPLNDLEAQAAKIRSQRHQPSAPRLSTRRKVYIGGTFLLCVLIIVVGSVNGVRLNNSHRAASAEAEAEAEAGADPIRQRGDEVAKMVANTKLLVEANVIQGDLQRVRPFGDDYDG